MYDFTSTSGAQALSPRNLKSRTLQKKAAKLTLLGLSYCDASLADSD